jgi:imidazolonepropionase-like amidohydrolase
MPTYVLHNGRFLDPRSDELLEGMEVLVEGNRIKDVSDRPIQSSAAIRIDIGNRTLMPGLIDAHVHIFLSEVNLTALEDVPLTLLAARGIASLRSMLMRGFTTLRDVGGADHGIKTAVQSGIVDSPRLFIAGKTISQTGGHGDFRHRTQSAFECSCSSAVSYTARLADGVTEVTHAVRDELRKGADHVKIMVSGGVASQSDPLESVQYRADEIEAACQEATRWGTYVAAHAYTAAAIKHAVGAGVRTIEHGNLIDAEAAALMADRGAFLVPTLVAYDSLRRRGRDYGLTDYSLAKNETVLHAGLHSLELARTAGVPIGFGSDLLGQLQNDHCLEFLIRREAMSPQEIIRSATLVNARILNREGQLGELVPGAFADLLVIDGNPYEDVSLFADRGPALSVIMKDGCFYRNSLSG